MSNKNRLSKKELEALKEISRNNRHSTDFSSSYGKAEDLNRVNRPTFSDPRPIRNQQDVDLEREQRRTDALNRLKVSQTKLAGDDEREGRRNKWILILLLLLFLILIGVAVFYFMRNVKNVVYSGEIRISMQIDNKDILTTITSTGQKISRPVFPGDTINLISSARNSNSMWGDSSPGDAIPSPVFLRYKVGLEIDGKVDYNILGIRTSNEWYKLNTSKNSVLNDDDLFYYYRGKLTFNQMVTMFEGITFIGENFGYENGGKYCKLVLFVESIEAAKTSLTESWTKAPSEWTHEMLNMVGEA